MTDVRGTSRVLTLVFTDLVDSTALKTARGDQAVDTLITRHREQVVRLAEESSGRIIDWAGDGCFLTFETSSAAVVFALRLQQVHADEADLPSVRIGIHLGEVTEQPGPDGDVQVKGLVVDVAARISGLARPGQVLMSTAVHNSARQRLGVETFGQPILWQAHGTYELKGFDEPMEIREAGIEGVAPLEAPKASEKARLVRRAKHASGRPKAATRSLRAYPIWAAGIIAVLMLVIGLLLAREFAFAPQPPAATREIGTITSIAVLPFESPGSPELQHRASGLADQLSTELNKIGAFDKIIARDTVVSSGLADRSEEEIARAFSVDALLKGTVTFEGTMVSINIRLTGANGVGELWGDTFTREFENSITMIGQMALAIARELYAEVTPEEQTRLARERPVDPEAFDLYLRARSYWQQHTRDDGLIAVELFKQAIEIDPEYALAHAGLAEAYMGLVNVFLSPHNSMRQARVAALEALSLDEELAEAHLALAYVSFKYDWDWQATERILRRVLELNPDLAAARIALAEILTSTRQFEEALREVERALQLDPYSAMVADTAAALFYITREYDRVIRHTQAQIDKYPNNPNFYLWRGAAYAKLEEFDDAIRNSLKAVELESNPITVAFLGGSYGAAGQRDKAMEMLEELDRQREAGLYVCSYEVASVYASMGDVEDAFRWLEEAYDERATCMPWLDADPRWDGIRDDPRFNDLLRSLGLGEYFDIEENAAAPN